LSSFIVGARKEIEMLWLELMMSDDEKSEFGAFIDGEHHPVASWFTATDASR
jgi:protein regulator of cytokinesis 1